MMNLLIDSFVDYPIVDVSVHAVEHDNYLDYVFAVAGDNYYCADCIDCFVDGAVAAADDAVPADNAVDVVVVEHIPMIVHDAFAEACGCHNRDVVAVVDG